MILDTTTTAAPTATVTTDDLLMAVFGKTIMDIVQEMGHNQTSAMILLAKHQTELNQAIIQITHHLLHNHVSASSLEMYLDTANSRFGLEGGSKLSLQKIGHKWDMSRERIRQVETSILRLLRLPTHQQLYLQAIKATIS